MLSASRKRSRVATVAHDKREGLSGLDRGSGWWDARPGGGVAQHTVAREGAVCVNWEGSIRRQHTTPRLPYPPLGCTKAHQLL